MAHSSVASNEPKVELDSHADTCVVGDNILVIHDHDRPVKVYSYHPKNGHRSPKTVDAAVEYQNPQSGQKFVLMLKQAIHINGLGSHSLFSMQCFLHGVNSCEVPKFLSENPSVTTMQIS